MPITFKNGLPTLPTPELIADAFANMPPCDGNGLGLVYFEEARSLLILTMETPTTVARWAVEYLEPEEVDRRACELQSIAASLPEILKLADAARKIAAAGDLADAALARAAGKPLH